MKRINQVSLPVVLILLIASILLGYFIGITVNTRKEPDGFSGNDELIGIWQANGFMASGWSDRYHFYANGKFHFYPSLMICQDKVDEEMGNWREEGGAIVFTITSRVSILRSCDQNGLGKETDRYVFELYQPETMTLRVVSLGILEDDFYPSILLDGRQYWKFSDDPTAYGDEQFPLE